MRYSGVMSIREAVRALTRYHFDPRSEPVKLDQNESPLDLPDALKARVVERLASVAFHRYPELHPVSLEGALARRHHWDPAGVVVANGSNVLLQALVIVAGIDQTVLSVSPTFPVYALQARLLGAELVEVPLGDGFALPVDRLRAAMRGRRGVLFLANPAAPTGNQFPETALLPLLEDAGEAWIIVLDEAYADFSGSDMRPLVRRYPGRAISVRTFSKAEALAGARIGYALMAPELAEQVRKALLPFSLSSLQAAVALSVLEEPGYTEARVARTRAERERLRGALAALPQVEVFPSVTNFLLFRVARASSTYDALLEAGVVVRRQDHLPGLKGCLRVTVGTPAENDAFLGALTGALAPEVVHD